MNKTNCEQKNSETEKEICLENTKNKQNVSSEKNPVTMQLVIAEKPSVAMALSAVLGANEKKDGYLEGNGYLVSWCVGHLLELAQPGAYGEQYVKWRYSDLPILPESWKYEVAKDKKPQLDLLCQLMKDKRVTSVVCATDVG